MLYTRQIMKVFFQNIQSTLLNELESAKVSIEIAVAWFTNALLMECLLKKLSNGIKVSLILNNDEINNNSSNRDYIEQLISNGCKIHWINYPELMHQKFCIIDSKVVVNGSYNWTYYAENHNRENIVILDNPSIAQSFHKEFLAMLSKYPSCDEIPVVGKSVISNTEISKYKNKDRQFWADFYNDVPQHKLETRWTNNSLLKVVVKSKIGSTLTVKWAQDDSEKVFDSEYRANQYIAEYNEESIFGHANKPGRQFFKIFANRDIDAISIYDTGKLSFENIKKITIPKDIVVLLYSSYSIISPPNEHLVYRYKTNIIPVDIRIDSPEIQKLGFSIETMLGIKEVFEEASDVNRLNIKYKSVPDGRCYYLVLRPIENTECQIHVASCQKIEKFNVSIQKGLTYYLGYICNLSNKYGTRKIFIQKGINK